MAERAHPDEPGFQDQWVFRLRKGIFPWYQKRKSPYRAAFLWRYEWVNKFCVDKDVVDIPCGMGWGTSLIYKTRSLIGIDLSREAVAEARQRYNSVARFEVGDMSKLCLSDSSVDIICCLEGIEHVPLEVGRKFLSEAQRVLRLGGRLLISSPYCHSKPHSGNPHHIHEYQPEEIKALLSQFFEIESCEVREVDIMTVLYLSCLR